MSKVPKEVEDMFAQIRNRPKTTTHHQKLPKPKRKKKLIASRPFEEAFTF